MTFKTPFLIAKYTRFEYFPPWLVYLPLLPYMIWLMVKSRSLTFFTAANPSIEMGGFFGESKIEILDKIPKEFLPRTIFFTQETNLDSVVTELLDSGIQFPFIIKPNVGERGYKVSKITNEADLQKYLSEIQADFIVQEFIDFPIELGILFHRLPQSKVGSISSVVRKEFLTVTGDGIKNIEQLLDEYLRFRLQLKRFRIEQPELLKIVLPKGEKKLMEPIGNHSRGTKFLDATDIVNEQLINIFSGICLQIDGFYYGRFDLKVASIEDLYQGKNIRIMELNGVSSDPGHIYDPKLSIWKAYYDIAKHFYYVYRISVANHKDGIPYTPLKTFLRTVYQHFWGKPEEPIPKKNA
jgi:ATP-grasp domain